MMTEKTNEGSDPNTWVDRADVHSTPAIALNMIQLTASDAFVFVSTQVHKRTSGIRIKRIFGILDVSSFITGFQVALSSMSVSLT